MVILGTLRDQMSSVQMNVRFWIEFPTLSTSPLIPKASGKTIDSTLEVIFSISIDLDHATPCSISSAGYQQLVWLAYGFTLSATCYSKSAKPSLHQKLPCLWKNRRKKTLSVSTSKLAVYYFSLFLSSFFFPKFSPLDPATADGVPTKKSHGPTRVGRKWLLWRHRSTPGFATGPRWTLFLNEEWPKQNTQNTSKIHITDTKSSLQKTYRIMYVYIYIHIIQYLFPLPIQKILQATYHNRPPKKNPNNKKKCLEIILSGQTSAMPPSPAHGAWFGGGGSWGSHSLHRANGALPGGFPPGTLRKPDRFHVVVKRLINV